MHETIETQLNLVHATTCAPYTLTQLRLLLLIWDDSVLGLKRGALCGIFLKFGSFQTWVSLGTLYSITSTNENICMEVKSSQAQARVPRFCRLYLFIYCLSNALHNSIGQNIKSHPCPLSVVRCPPVSVLRPECEKLQMAITQQRVIRSTSCLVLAWVF